MPSISVRNPLPLLVAALAGPLAWSVQLMVNYFLVEAACMSGVLLFWTGPLSMAAWIMLVVTLLALVATAYGGWVSFQAREQVQAEAEGDEERATQRALFMARTGIYLSVIFLLLVLITGLPVLVLHPCA